MSPLRRLQGRSLALDELPAAPVPPSAEVDVLLELANDPDAGRRRQAVSELGALVAATVTSDLDLHPHPALRVLVERVGAEDDPGVREAVLAQLARFDRPEVVHGLLPHLSGSDAALRSGVVDTLARLRDGCAQVLPGLLADADPDVRIHGVMIVSLAPDLDPGLRLLVGLVEQDPVATVTAAAACELVRLAGAEHRASLLQARDRFPDDPFIGYLIGRCDPAVAGRR